MTLVPARRTTAAFAAMLMTTGALAGCDLLDSGNSPGPAVTNGGSSSGSTARGSLSPTGADLSAYTSQRLQWSADRCPSSMDEVLRRSRRTQCAQVTAPKDYADPSHGNITLLVARTTAKREGARPLFSNPGGPGAPAGSFSAIVAALTSQGETHDVYGIDPRGTGGSTPVSCKRYAADSDDASDQRPATVRAEQQAAQKTVQDCWKAHGDYLPYITTDNTARDQDLVRGLIHADQVDYYGVSAGTWLGARYATLFPSHVGRFVLDSNTDFVAGFDRTFNAQAQGFQRRFDEQFVPWLARHDSTYAMGGDVETVKRTYAQIRDAAKAGRLGQFTPDAVDGLSAQSLYNDRSFRSLGALLGLLHAAADGDDSALRSAERAAESAGGGGGSSSDDTVFMATLCNDTAWPKDPAAVSSAEQQAGSRYPLVGYTSPGMQCAYWPKSAPQTKVDLAGAPNVLMIQTELDPATPYGPAQEAHQATSNTRLLSVEDQGNHGAYVGGGNPCVEKVTADFLDRGQLIGQDSVCPAVPLPSEDQVYPVGAKLPGTQLPMPQSQNGGLGSLIRKFLEALLDQILQQSRR